MGGNDVVIDPDFTWVGTDEPHATRRVEILKKHPEIRKLMGHDPKSRYLAACLVFSQVLACYLLQNQPWWVIFLAAYCFGGVVNHALELSIHELAHNLYFKGLLANKLFALFCNLPCVVASAVTFKRYHLEHHKYQGVDGVDVDIPSRFEGNFFTNSFLKFIWVCLQAVWYGLRPLVVNPKPLVLWEVINWVSQLAFNAVIVHFFGWKMLAYLALCDFLGLGIHPVAGHFIAEHYTFVKGVETYSYYGPLNYLTWNVGYHNEHHDFPNIPGSRLPEVRRLAPEFYDNLPYHTSWVKVIYDYIMDPAVGPYSRVKRHPKKGETIGVDDVAADKKD